jgi:rhodanese-related sulfurtransferase
VSRFSSVDDLLAQARSRLRRVTPDGAVVEIGRGARLVDIRPQWQRIEVGEIPDALVVERNHLEWRLDPNSEARVPLAVAGQRWIVVCQQGYTSSLAAAALNSIGVPATDLIGGYLAWAEAGLPTSETLTAPDQVVIAPR